MSINGAIHIGRTALNASQAAMQVAGNNMANAATEGFHRRRISLTPMRGQQLARQQYIGRGVDVLSIRREVDTALQSRFRQAAAEHYAALTDQQFLTQIETLQNELTDNDISSLLSEFFNAFSEVANNPSDDAVRSVAIQQGVNLADRIGRLREGYADVRTQVDQDLGASILRVNELLDEVASINREIALAEATAGEASALRDQRDILIDEVAEYVDITVVNQATGVADVFIGSIPVVLAAENRGITLRTESDQGDLSVSVRVNSDGTILEPSEGRIGGLLRQRSEAVQPEIEALDEFAAQLIFNVNRIHAQGQGKSGYGSISGSYRIDDTTANLNSIDANLPFRVENGSFILNVTNTDSGLRSTYQINVDGDAISLDDLIDDINTVTNVPNVTASVNANGQFALNAAPGFEISFSDDSSGALAALGVNGFFTGKDAGDIDVNATLINDASLLSVGLDHIGGSNGTAIALANLQEQPIDAINGRSLREYWQQNVNNLAVRTSAANREVEASGLVQESLRAQIQSTTGVSLDEESINLLTHQRQYQAAARYITVIDEMLQTLISIAR